MTTRGIYPGVVLQDEVGRVLVGQTRLGPTSRYDTPLKSEVPD